jgi:hypothetical protein
MAGTHIYCIVLKGLEPQRKTVEKLSAEVGKVATAYFSVSNSLKTSIKIKCDVSNSRYFQVNY